MSAWNEEKYCIICFFLHMQKKKNRFMLLPQWYSTEVERRFWPDNRAIRCEWELSANTYLIVNPNSNSNPNPYRDGLCIGMPKHTIHSHTDSFNLNPILYELNSIQQHTAIYYKFIFSVINYHPVFDKLLYVQ